MVKSRDEKIWLEVEEPPSVPMQPLNSKEMERAVQELLTMIREIPEESILKAIKDLEEVKIIRGGV